MVGVIHLQIYSMVYVDCSLMSRYTSHVIVVPAQRYYPITGLDKPIGLQEVDASRISAMWHMKVARLSAVCTGHLYHTGYIPGTHFC